MRLGRIRSVCKSSPLSRCIFVGEATRIAARRVTNPSTRDDVKTDWAAVYRATYGELVRYLAWSVMDEDRARDLAQEAFARVLGQDADNARALVFKVAINLVRDEARTVVRRKRHLALLKVEADVEVETRASPAEQAERSEAVERLRRALESLSERDREVLLLWDAGLSYTDIAEQTGLAKTALGTTIARAKKKLVEAHAALEANDAALG
jgi:RNA polymerase sigma-70 factor, ECF subfamily